MVVIFSADQNGAIIGKNIQKKSVSKKKENRDNTPTGIERCLVPEEERFPAGHIQTGTSLLFRYDTRYSPSP
jgi:hypothetical protein